MIICCYSICQSGQTINQDRHAFASSTYLPSLMSSIKARPACFCKEFCHSCEQSSITNSTTELLFLKVVNPTTQISLYIYVLCEGQESLSTSAIKVSITVYLYGSQHREFTHEEKDA
jgi:hypothetical protein